MSFTLYRLELGDPGTWHEQLGDEITNTGGAAVPAIRSALRHEVSLLTFAPEANGETVETRLRLRRQLRSLMNNTPFKITGLFVHWPTDPEQDGWYMPDKGQLEDGEGSTGIATGYFKMAQFVWFKVGAPRTHRKAMWVYLKDLRTGLSPRDYRQLVYSKDFSTLSALALTYLPPDISDAASAASGATATLYAGPTGFDGGSCQVAAELIDNLRVSFEQPVASRNLGQVIAYDRRGTFTAPTKEVGAGWEEIYGPDYAYNWVEGGEIDTPVLTNGICRIWYNREGTAPGWSVDVWTGTEWAQQGKILISDDGVQTNILISSQLIEYSETRVVIQAAMTRPGAENVREVVYITLQRGWSGPRIEVYPSLGAYGRQRGGSISFFLYGEDLNVGVAKIDSESIGHIISTAGTGSKFFGGFAELGDFTFTGENEVMILRQDNTSNLYAANIAVIQASNTAYTTGLESLTSRAYGKTSNKIEIISAEGAGYVRIDLGFYPFESQQTMGAGNMSLGTGTTREGEESTSATRTSDSNAHVIETHWCNGHFATYRVFALVHTSSSSITLNIYAKTVRGTTGATKTTTSTTPVWLDLGDIWARGTTFEIHCWASSAGTVFVERIEAFKVEDRDIADEVPVEYNGGRDLGQSVLLDSRTIPTLVTRSV